MDPTERWIRTLLMCIFYDVYRDRHLSVAYLEAPFRESAFIPILSFPPSNSHVYGWLRGMDSGDFIFDESACEAWNGAGE